MFTFYMYIISILELIEWYSFCASIWESFALAEMLLDFVRYTQSISTVMELEINPTCTYS